MTPLVLVENEVTAGGLFDHWQDVTGERYQFPNNYKNKVLPGRRFVYYRGVRRADGSRGPAEYFGCGVLGQVYEDPNNDPDAPKAQRKWISDIEEYAPFSLAVPAKDGPEQIASNLWGVAVRHISEETYAAIMSHSGLAPTLPEPALPGLVLPPIEQVVATISLAPLLLPQPQHVMTGVKRAAASPRHSRFSAALGKRGEEIVMNYLRKTLPLSEAATLRWRSVEGATPGWDIDYVSGELLIAIEVKATGGPAFPSIELSANEWRAATECGPQYRLMLVTGVRGTSPQIQCIDGPAVLAASGFIQAVPAAWCVTSSSK